MLTKLQKAVARNAFRQASKLSRAQSPLWLQSPPSPDEFQQYSLLSSTEEALIHVYPSELSSLITKFPTRMIDGPTLRKIVHEAFRLPLQSPDDVALESLRFLNGQMNLSKTTSIETTECLRIVVTSLYDVDREIDATGQHIFFYRVLFENISDTDVVQLMGRHWKFSCEDRVVSEVPKFGQGVIGQYPVLQPGNYDFLKSLALTLYSTLISC